MTDPVWKIPCSELTVDTEFDYADRFRLYHSKNMPAELRTFASGYSLPVKNKTAANTTVSCTRRSGFNGPINLTSNIPWNISWNLSSGSDSALIIRDYTNGYHYGFWGVLRNKDVNPFASNPNRAFLISGSILAGACYLVTDTDENPVDIETFLGNFPGGTGSGYPPHPVMESELDAGLIQHWVPVYISNAMKGPDGFAVSPAGSYEQRATVEPESNWNEIKAIPEGCRIGFDPAIVTDSYITDWLDSRSYTGTLRQYAQTIAVAIRDYGMFVQATGPNAGVICEEISSISIPNDLMYGLIDYSNLNLVSYLPPISTLTNGATVTRITAEMDNGWSDNIEYADVEPSGDPPLASPVLSFGPPI